MKVTTENINSIDYIAECSNIEVGKKLLNALLNDVKVLNAMFISAGKADCQVYIDYFNTHTEYSSERTESCPDYFGMFTIRCERDNNIIGDEMTLDLLDHSILIMTDTMSIITSISEQDALDRAKPYGLEEEVYNAIRCGNTPWEALYEWDLLEIEELEKLTNG